MRKRRMTKTERFVKYLRRTFRNKIYALGMIGAGALPMLIDYDATAFVLMLFFGIPLFFASENWIC